MTADIEIRAMLSEKLERGLSEEHPPFSRVPSHMHDAIRSYVLDHVRPGEFLTALLMNNLRRTFEEADDKNIEAIRDWLYLLHWHVPGNCCGSPTIVGQWCSCILCGGRGCETCEQTGMAYRCANPCETWHKADVPNAV